MEIFKNICTVLVLMQAFAVIGLVFLITVSDHVTGKTKDKDRDRGIGKHAFCTLTEKPCIYASGSDSSCEDCPAAQQYFYELEEKRVDKVSGIQDEGRAD